MARKRKIYLLCPWHKTGGPEDIHQLCHAINTRGGHDFEALIVYYQAGPGFADLPADGVLYTGEGYYDSAEIRRAAIIEDHPGNVVVLPEVLPLESLQGIGSCLKVSWWLSLAVGLRWKDAHLEACREGAWMAFHARHAWSEIVPAVADLGASGRCLMLSDYIRKAFWRFPWDPGHKRDLVVYNANRDRGTGLLCARMGIPALGLCGLDQKGVMAALAGAKVYVDLGFHPGKDHLPREAAILGCVVITNRQGCAVNSEDLPIAEKCANDMEVLVRIGEGFTDYHGAYARQSDYHAMLRGEQSVFLEQVREFLDRLT